MIFDIDDCFIETNEWEFYQRNPEDDEDNTAYLEVYNPESPNKRTAFVFKNGDIQTFRNLIRRQLSLGKNYVQFRRTIDSSKEEK